MREITFQSVVNQSSVPLAGLGDRGVTPDGRIFQYVKLNEAASFGFVVVPVAVTGVDTVSSSADRFGVIRYITEASAGWTVGQFADYWLVVDDGTGEGQTAKVRTNTADTLELYPEYALSTALDVADSDITLFSPGLVEKSAITDKTQRAAGVVQLNVSSGYYAWAQMTGIGRVIAGEVLTEGGSFVAGDDTEGEVVKGTTAKGDFDEQTIGICVAANSTADKGALGEFTLI